MASIVLNRCDHRSPELTVRAAEIARRIADPQATKDIATYLSAFNGFARTPLVSLVPLAAALGVDKLQAKDERNRWGQGSFKVLGGAYAVLSLDGFAQTSAPNKSNDPRCTSGREPSQRTFTASTAGNHGRAVAFGASLVGARTVIFVPQDVPADQVAAIERLGAEIVHVSGDYEEATRLCHEQNSGWTVVSDIACEGYEEIPARIMQGYTVLAAEILEVTDQPPTHVVVQAGVGGLAASLVAYFVKNVAPRPVCVVVEADASPCLLESAQRGRPVLIKPGRATTMGRLNCRVPSSLSWPMLALEANAFVAIDDAMAEHATFKLARQGLVTSPSGGAGLAGLMAIVEDDEARNALGIDGESRILIIITEQPTARDLALISS